MKSKRFTEEQIIRILQEADSGLSVANVCLKHNCPEHSFYRWKAKFGGMEVSEPSACGSSRGRIRS
jgi:putative transposase